MLCWYCDIFTGAMWESVSSFRLIEGDNWRSQEKEKRGPKLASSVLPHALATHGVLDPEDETV
jgi:hypothetical protein